MDLKDLKTADVCAAFSRALDKLAAEKRIKQIVIAEKSGIEPGKFHSMKYGRSTPTMEKHIKPIEAVYPGFIAMMEEELAIILGETTAQAAQAPSTSGALGALEAKALQMLELMQKDRDHYRKKYEDLQDEVREMLLKQILKKD